MSNRLPGFVVQSDRLVRFGLRDDRVFGCDISRSHRKDVRYFGGRVTIIDRVCFTTRPGSGVVIDSDGGCSAFPYIFDPVTSDDPLNASRNQMNITVTSFGGNSLGEEGGSLIAGINDPHDDGWVVPRSS